MTSNVNPASPNEFVNSVLHQLRRANKAYSLVWQQHVPDLTPPQFAVLYALCQQGRLDQCTLCAVCAIDRSTLTPLLDRLEMRGLITKTTDPDNRRRRLIELTAEGEEHARDAIERARATDRWIAKALRKKQAQQLATLLRSLGDAAPSDRQS